MALIETPSQAASEISHDDAPILDGATVRRRGAPRSIEALEAEREELAARLKAAEQLVAKQRARLAVLESLTVTDELTGINNRRGFLADLKDRLARARRHPAARGVLMLLDVDGFKEVNDCQGHPAGDAYLRRVAELLTSAVRETDSVSRLGGDEFAVLLADTDEANGRRRAAEIVARVNAASSGRGAARTAIRVSYGAEPYSGADEAADLIRRADQALYRNKAERSGGRSAPSRG